MVPRKTRKGLRANDVLFVSDPGSSLPISRIRRLSIVIFRFSSGFIGSRAGPIRGGFGFLVAIIKSMRIWAKNLMAPVANTGSVMAMGIHK